MKKMFVLKNRYFTICLILLVFIQPFFAEQWTFEARKLTNEQGRESNRTILEGSARIKSEKMEIVADYLEFTGKDNTIIRGHGRVVMKSLEKNIVIEANRLEYDRDIKVIKLRELVTLIDEAQNIILRCESMDFFEDEDLVIMQASVRLFKDDTVGRGEFANYQRDKKILELSGKPIVWQKDDKYEAEHIVVNLETDEVSMEGSITGEMYTEDN